VFMIRYYPGIYYVSFTNNFGMKVKFLKHTPAVGGKFETVVYLSEHSFLHVEEEWLCESKVYRDRFEHKHVVIMQKCHFLEGHPSYRMLQFIEDKHFLYLISM
jgi:hypothetical protein